MVTRTVELLRQFSIPLILGIVAALVAANVDPEFYRSTIGWRLFGSDFLIFGHPVTLLFVINDIFMVFFFGIAAKEITESFLPGGSLNPIKNAANPLISTLGGVIGPIAVFFVVLALLQSFGLEDSPHAQRGWGIPTATDIALAWLVASAVFPKGSPAISFLLLLAVADDGIGLVIIAIFYGDPAHPARPEWLLLVVGAMIVAYFIRRILQTERFAWHAHWWPFIMIAGLLSWIGLMKAHLHPALALVFIVPFIPGPQKDSGLYVEDTEDHSLLQAFEHATKIWVDFGLFFFAFTNAGVEFAEIGPMTWIILTSLVIGKTLGITLFGLLARRLGFPLPGTMGVRELIGAAFIASLGLTVALFVAGAAFGAVDPILAGQAKMGALFTGFVGIIAVIFLRPIFRKRNE
ncbi:MAG: Na+/H+ antiporter NhaA [Candidatus Magasanikbacteria bacterium]|nr:Na+/H+ antiporter NhaA [Candidatus Magasanikbacteria bacterium]